MELVEVVEEARLALVAHTLLEWLAVLVAVALTQMLLEAELLVKVMLEELHQTHHMQLAEAVVVLVLLVVMLL
jgi:hypothetical protein